MLEVLSLLWVLLWIVQVINEAMGVLCELVEGLDKCVPLRRSLDDCDSCWFEHIPMTPETWVYFTISQVHLFGMLVAVISSCVTSSSSSLLGFHFPKECRFAKSTEASIFLLRSPLNVNMGLARCRLSILSLAVSRLKHPQLLTPPDVRLLVATIDLSPQEHRQYQCLPLLLL